MHSFQQKVSVILAELTRAEFGLEAPLPLWELPSKPGFGDLSSMTAMKLSGVLKRSPQEIAEILKDKLTQRLGDEVEKIEVVNPAFINIHLSRAVLVNTINEVLTAGDQFFQRSLKRRVLIEFVSANPTGPLSVAHGRQAVVGDTIANILKFCGNEVTKEYYINDCGHQIDMLVESVRARMNELDGKECVIPEDGYFGDYIKDIAKLCQEKNPSNLRQFILDQMVELIKGDLASLGIVFDSWVSQRKLIDEGYVQSAIAALTQRGHMFDQEGALWFRSTTFGDDKDRVIKKADGELTYFASDIALHKDKMERKYDKLINLWGPDHHGYIARVKASLKALGYDESILDILIIQLVTIKTKQQTMERMSRRKGTAILLRDVAQEAGEDACRFYYITRRNSSQVEFDVDLAKEKSFNNSLYYIQYGCARIESIFKKAGVQNYNIEKSSALCEDGDFLLLRTILQFFNALEKAYYTLEPVFVIEYLKNLAAVLHKFYENQRVLSDDKDLTQARLNLLRAAQITIHCALNILGITPAKEM
jgi:arginyl-tRNA synthetase